MKQKWYFEHCETTSGWGVLALFPAEAIVSIRKNGVKIIDPAKVAIYSGEGWDADMQYNDNEIETVLNKLNS